MTDRELLEAAAKAAGVELVGPVEKFIVQFEDRHKGGFIVRNARGGDSAWNPIIDDGDALRLAVKLGIRSEWNHRLGEATADYFDGREISDDFCETGDPYAATRRAIVRAAAAMAPSVEQTGP